METAPVDSVSVSPAAISYRRAEVYRLLGALFHFPPRSEERESMATVARLLREAGLAATASAVDDLARLARRGPEEELLVEFNGLFMVPGKQYVAPYESVYVDAPIEAGNRATPRTFGPSTRAVMAFYQAIGLSISTTYTELPDFIGLQMACMEYLCRRETEYLQAKDALGVERARAFQRRFLEEHLARWTPALVTRIREKAATAYGRALAALTLHWVQLDRAAPSARA